MANADEGYAQTGDTYTLHIQRSSTAPHVSSAQLKLELDDALEETQENVTRLLPAGYRAVIRRPRLVCGQCGSNDVGIVRDSVLIDRPLG